MWTKKRLFLIFIVITVCLSGCEKKLLSYRNKWVGEYKFSYSHSSWIMGSFSNSNFNLETTGRIFYHKKGKNTNIVIVLDDVYTYMGDVLRSGELEICGVNGEFKDKNNVEFEFSSQQCGGGLGGGIKYNIKGFKM